MQIRGREREGGREREREREKQRERNREKDRQKELARQRAFASGFVSVCFYIFLTDFDLFLSFSN